MELLRCQACSAPLRKVGDGWACTGCRSHGDIDAAGVLHLEMPGETGATMVSSAAPIGLDAQAPAIEVSERISEVIGTVASGTPTHWRYLASFLPNPAGFAVLGAVHRGTRSLVLSSGWGRLPRVISSLGGEVVAMDSLHDGLLYTRLQQSNGTMGCVFSSLRLPLPFADDAFDSVFLDDIATGTPAPAGNPSRRPPGKEPLLAECARVLRPGGHVVLQTWNRASPFPHEPPPELGRGQSRTKPTCVTRNGFVTLLKRSGFESPRCFVPWPDHGTWDCMVEASELKNAGLELEGGSWKHRLAQIALDLSAQLGIADYLVPSHCFVARAPGSPSTEAGSSPGSTLQAIARAVGAASEAISRLDVHANSNCVSFRTERLFVKIPLTRGAAERIANASRVLAGAPAAMTNDGFIVAPRPGVEAGGIPLGVYPLVPHEDPNGEWVDKVARVAHALDRLGAADRHVPLGMSDFWRRVTSARSRDDLQRLQPDHGLYERLSELEARRVPTGLVHGDLAWGNLIRDRGGEIRLIDWDRCERASPRFLDAVHACHSLARTWHFLKHPDSTADRILEAWRLLLSAEPELPLLERIEESRGELSWQEVVGLTILNEIDQHHRTLRENPILRNEHHDRLLARFHLVIRHLGGWP